MIKRLQTLLLLLVFGLSGAIAQNKPVQQANYRAAELFSPSRIEKMVFSTSVEPNWLKTGDKFWYSYKTSEGKFYYIVDLDEQTKKPLFDNDKMAAMLTEITKDPYDGKHLPEIDPDFKKNDTVFQFDVTSSQDEKEEEAEEEEGDDKEEEQEEKKEEEKEKEENNDKKKPEKKVFHLEYNLQTGQLYEIEDWEEEKEDPKWASISPNGEYVVFARDYNLYWMDRENYEKAKQEEEGEKDSTIVEHQLTTEGEQYYAFGGGYTAKDNDDEEKIKEEQEKRRRARIVWSQDSKKFALVRRDQREVKSLWVVDVLAKPRPELETYKYTMPGEDEAPQYELWVFDMESEEGKEYEVEAFNDQTISIEQEVKTHKQKIKDYVPRTWLSKTSDKLYFSRHSRDLHMMDVCELDLKTGEVTVLIEERLNTYIEAIDHDRLHMLGDGEEFIHWSERDGWAHYYLYDGDGNMKRQITSGPWHAERILKVDEENRVMYFIAKGHEKNQNPYYAHLYRINLDGTGMELLNKGNFNHSSEMSDSYRYFVDNYSRVNTVPRSVVRDNKGNVVMDLETADLSNLFAAGYKFPEPFKVKADDGITDIYGVMYKPFDFDTTKKYPILEYVYPGPQTEAVNASFSARMDRTDRFAQLGFVVITLGNRGGHPDRSKWYHNYGYGDLRDYGLADKKYAVEQLAQRHDFIDIQKVGISGHSGGGFMSTAALCQYPDFYKVAVSSAGNHDNNIYNRWWSETHHGVDEVVNDEGESDFLYQIETNPQLASNLKGKLLLVHGDIDNNVHPGNTLRMANALIKAKKRFDIFFMPGQRHGFGDYTEYFFWLKADYFCKHLMGDYSISTNIFQMRRQTKMAPGNP